MATIKNLVFEGGGVKGIAYIGVINALRRHSLYSKIDGWAGASAGSIMAMLGAMRVSYSDLYEIIWNTNFKTLQDDSIGYIRDIIRLFRKFGFYKGDKLYNWLGFLCHKYCKNMDISFNQIYNKYDSDLRIVATDINTCKPVYFNKNTHPDLPIRDAIRASCSIPLYYTAKKIEKDIYVDGGLISNFPIYVFDYKEDDQLVSNPHTVGCKLITSKSLIRIDGKMNCKKFAKSLAQIIMDQVGNMHIKTNDWKRSIKIPTGVIGATDFNLTKDQKKSLIDAGFNAATQFLEGRMAT